MFHLLLSEALYSIYIILLKIEIHQTKSVQCIFIKYMYLFCIILQVSPSNILTFFEKNGKEQKPADENKAKELEQTKESENETPTTSNVSLMNFILQYGKDKYIKVRF